MLDNTISDHYCVLSETLLKNSIHRKPYFDAAAEHKLLEVTNSFDPYSLGSPVTVMVDTFNGNLTDALHSNSIQDKKIKTKRGHVV